MTLEYYWEKIIDLNTLPLTLRTYYGHYFYCLLILFFNMLFSQPLKRFRIIQYRETGLVTALNDLCAPAEAFPSATEGPVLLEGNRIDT